MRMSLTNELTIFANAAPRTTAIARSMTLPLSANSLNSFTMLMVVSSFWPVILTCAVHSAPMIRQIAVIGTGTMGRGIAYLSALAGYETVIHDSDPSALDAARGAVESLLRKGVEKKKVSDSGPRHSRLRDLEARRGHRAAGHPHAGTVGGQRRGHRPGHGAGLQPSDGTSAPH